MLQQEPLRLRPFDWVERVLALVARGTEQLDIPPPIRAAKRDRHDVVDVVSVTNRDTAQRVGTLPPLHPADVLDISKGVLARGAAFLRFTVPLTGTALLGERLRPGAGLSVKPLLVGLPMLAAALSHLGAVCLGVGLRCRNVLRPLRQIPRTASSGVVWPNAGAIARNARLVVDTSTIDVAAPARLAREVMAKAHSLRFMSTDDLHFVAVRA